MSSLGHKAFRIVISFLVLWFICWSSSRNIPIILQRRQPRYLSIWWAFCYVVWFRVFFSFSRDTLSYFFFFYFHLFNSLLLIFPYTRGCFDQYIVDLLSLLFSCGTLSVPQEQSVAYMRIVNLHPNFLHQRLARYGSIVFGGPFSLFFLSMRSILWSSIRVCQFLLNTYSLQQPVCRGWK